MTVLVAYDGSRPAQKAVGHAVEKYSDEEVVLLRVVEVSTGSLAAGIDLIQERLKEEREEVSTEVSEEVEELVDTTDVEFAEETDVDTIVVGSHGREGVSRVFLGGVAEKVVRRAPMTVTVVR